ncbi:hypothetical protein VE02_06367 [Pseudogymnoascus sp. 03VT05]|nr:hypothetical protein VE02_06367 [Pseudogymnoascus sp. 03VT05]
MSQQRVSQSAAAAYKDAGGSHICIETYALMFILLAPTKYSTLEPSSVSSMSETRSPNLVHPPVALPQAFALGSDRLPPGDSSSYGRINY